MDANTKTKDLIEQIKLIVEFPVFLSGQAKWSDFGEEFKNGSRNCKFGKKPSSNLAAIKYAGFFKVRNSCRVGTREVIEFCKNLSLFIPSKRGLLKLTEFSGQIPKEICFYGLGCPDEIRKVGGLSGFACLYIDSEGQVELSNVDLADEIFYGSGFIALSSCPFRETHLIFQKPATRKILKKLKC